VRCGTGPRLFDCLGFGGGFGQEGADESPPMVMSPWDIAFDSAIMSDYNFRGITQSNHHPSVASYFESRYKFNDSLQGYLGLSGESISFPNRAAAEIDFYGLRGERSILIRRHRSLVALRSGFRR
jgi:Bacterial protein of unknown function (Gcw_chp)